MDDTGPKSLRRNRNSVQLITKAREIYLDHPYGLTDDELGGLLGVSRITAWRYRHEFEMIEVEPGRYKYKPTADEIAQARAILIAAGE